MYNILGIKINCENLKKQLNTACNIMILEKLIFNMKKHHRTKDIAIQYNAYNIIAREIVT